MSLTSEIFGWLEDLIKHSREVTRELEALKAKLKKEPELDDSASADAEKTIKDAMKDHGD